MARADYPPEVQRHFFEPLNVGPLQPAAGERVCRGEAGSAQGGAHVLIEAAVSGDEVSHMAFRARGCPYLLAACSCATAQLAPGRVQQLAAFDVRALARQLGAPAEKLGSLLILQDALRNCFRDWDTTPPAAPR